MQLLSVRKCSLDDKIIDCEFGRAPFSMGDWVCACCDIGFNLGKSGRSTRFEIFLISQLLNPRECGSKCRAVRHFVIWIFYFCQLSPPTSSAFFMHGRVGLLAWCQRVSFAITGCFTQIFGWQRSVEFTCILAFEAPYALGKFDYYLPTGQHNGTDCTAPVISLLEE